MHFDAHLNIIICIFCSINEIKKIKIKPKRYTHILCKYAFFLSGIAT